MIGIGAIEWLWIAWIRLTPIGNPLPGIPDHVHAPIWAGSLGIAADRSTLIHPVSTAARVVVSVVVALLRIPSITPRPGVGVLLLLIPSCGLFPFRLRWQSPACPFAVCFGFIMGDAYNRVIVRLCETGVAVSMSNPFLLGDPMLWLMAAFPWRWAARCDRLYRTIQHSR